MIEKIHRFFSNRRYWLVICIFVLTAITLALTLLPVDRVLPSKIWSYDKLGHLAIFGSWTFLVGYYRYVLKSRSINLFLIFFVGVLFGIGIEVLQYLLPLNRQADFFDVAFDALGCFVAVLILYKVTSRNLWGNKQRS